MIQAASLKTQVWFYLIALGLIWGGVFLAARIALDEVPVLTAVAHRLFWAAVIMWIYIFWNRLKFPWDRKTLSALLVMGFLNNILPFALLNFAQLHIESGLTSIFNASTAFFGLIVAAIFLPDEGLTRARLFGVLLGLSGVIVTVGLDTLYAFNPRDLAQFAAILATVSYAFAAVWARKTLSHLPPQVAATGMVTAATIVLLPVSLLVDGPPDLALSTKTWGAIGYMSVIATALAYLLYYRILAMAGSGSLLLVTLIIPPVAIVLGATVLHETLEPSAFVGLALLSFGLLVIDGRIFKRRSI